MFYCVLDTETTNGFEDSLVYDIGWSIIDEAGNVQVTRSFVNSDIFLNSELMSVAFFKDKIPQYEEDLKNGSRKMVNFMTARSALQADCKIYNVKAIIAHNMRFDYSACQTTIRYLTKSKYRYFFPFGVELWDSLKMAKEVFLPDSKYQAYCKEKDFMVPDKSRPKLTAEVLHRYLSGNDSFVESHTGLEDTLIEKDIFVECYTNRKCSKVKCFDTNFIEIYNGRDSYFVECRCGVIGAVTVSYDKIPDNKWVVMADGSFSKKLLDIF